MYSNVYILDEFLYEGRYYIAHVEVETSMKAPEDWEWKFKKVILLNEDYQCEAGIINPDRALFTKHQLSFIDERLSQDYLDWESDVKQGITYKDSYFSDFS